MADESRETNKSSKRNKKQKDVKNPKKQKTKRKAGFNENIYKETEYFIKDGLRHVKPYHFTFTTFCKGRWLKRKLIDVLAKEFQSETAEYYSKAIQNGNITVNGNNVAEDLILKNNDIISHKVHRHEPPVTTKPILIIKESDDMVVVNKPSSIPIHPCGRYRHNTLVILLGREFGLTNLYTIHRIDRLTSGIVMFAKTLKKAQELEKQLREREMQKEYVCKVNGEFPSGVIECDQPIAVVSHKIGVCTVHPEGKPCRTVFTRESYDGTNSIVKCQPFTGRMHQIRVHLQWLGHPIIDDPIYNHQAWGPNRGNGGEDVEKAWKVIKSIATALRDNDEGINSQMLCNMEANKSSDLPKTSDKVVVCSDSIEPALEEQLSQQNLSEERVISAGDSTSCPDVKTGDPEKQSSSSEEIKETCPNCNECRIQRRDPSPKELSMCLHAAVYKGPDWEYRCPWPQWALPQEETQKENQQM